MGSLTSRDNHEHTAVSSGLLTVEPDQRAGGFAHESDRMRPFEQAVREHVQHPPTEWTIKRITARPWYVVGPPRRADRRSNHEEGGNSAIDDSTERRIWDESCAWYRGESTDPRTRELTTDEKAIVAEVLVEIASSEGADGG